MFFESVLSMKKLYAIIALLAMSSALFAAPKRDVGSKWNRCLQEQELCLASGLSEDFCRQAYEFCLQNVD